MQWWVILSNEYTFQMATLRFFVFANLITATEVYQVSNDPFTKKNVYCV